MESTNHSLPQGKKTIRFTDDELRRPMTTEEFVLLTDEEQERRLVLTGKTKPTITIADALQSFQGPATVQGVVVSMSEPYKKKISEDEFRNARNIQLQDVMPKSDLDRLDAIVYDDNVNGIVVGETVTIAGAIRIEKIKNNFKNVLHAEMITREGKHDVSITEQDISNFKEFAKSPAVIKNLTAMFAPQIIGHDDVKRGLLRSAVGGIETEGKRGRINTLNIGLPGESKTMLSKEAVKIVPNSKYVSATHASGKSLIGIVDKEGDSKVFRIGAVPLAKGGICVINEIGTMDYSDQSYLLDIMEEGHTTVNKYGMNIEIHSPTTIIATANPIGGLWKDQDNISTSEMPILRTLVDRCDQVYNFKTETDQKILRTYAELKRYSTQIVPDYAFLIKYVQYAKTIVEVSIPAEVYTIINDAWIEMVSAGLAGKRTLDGLVRLVEAQTKLHLSNIATIEIAEEVIDDVRTMLKQMRSFVEILADPKEITIKEITKVVKDLKGEAILFQEAAKAACQNNEQVRAYLGNDLRASDNIKYRRVQESFLQRTPEMLKLVDKKPLRLAASDLCDPYDRQLLDDAITN